MIEKIYKKAIYALARVAVKYIELRKKREQKKIKQNKSANLTNSTKAAQMLNTIKGSCRD